MKHFAIAAAPIAAAAALALLTFFQFPGHTWLQQDSQIYVPILEHLRDPSVLRNDILAQHPHVAFTLYDEAARALRSVTGLGFREVLAMQQLATRALGIWGLILMAQAMGLSLSCALLVTGICSLGAAIAGPAVLTLEYEPTPRAFAVPLLVCAIGLASRDRFLAAGIAGACAFLYHPPTALPFWGLFVLLTAVRPIFAGMARRSLAVLAPLPVAIGILLIAARAQGQGGGAQAFFERLTPLQEQLQRMRASYTWVSTWAPTVIVHHLMLFAILAAAFVRLRHKSPPVLTFFLLGLPVLGLVSMPASWLLLEQWKWTLAPQVQPMRALLFVALMMQFLTAVAGVYAVTYSDRVTSPSEQAAAPEAHCRPAKGYAVAGRRYAEALAWFALAYLLPLQPVIAAPPVWGRAGLVLLLAAITVLVLRRAPVAAPAVGAAAFFVIPLAGVVNYPRLHTPELAQLSRWARSSTPDGAVFVFPDAAHALDPGIFRGEALRAVYVDWKGGGQVNYFKDLGEQWWSRWQQTVGAGFQPADVAKYGGLGIEYLVVQERNRLPRPAAFENSKYIAYQLR